MREVSEGPQRGVQSVTTTIAELQEQLKFSNYRRHLKIEDRRTGTLVTFVPNSVQRKLRAEIVSQLQAGRPVRIWVLKSRRMGISTMIQATFAHFAFTTRRFNAITGAHLDDSSEHLHGMTEQMYEALPDALQKTKRTGLRGKRIKFTDGSGLSTFTAGGGSGVGRGKGTRAVHASEVAFWPDAKGTLLALRQIVPDEPGTMFIGESTAQGIEGEGGEFYSEWCRAVNGSSDYTAMFFAWFEFEDYRKLVVEPLGDLSDDELALRRLGVDDGQLTWRRHTIANECGGDLDMFHQEYPAYPEEAFLSTAGRPVFITQQLAIADALLDDPWDRGFLTGTPVANGKLTWIPAEDGGTHIYAMPQDEHQYAIWADVAGGGVSEADDAQRDPGDKLDYSAAQVVDLATGRIVCEYEARIDPDMYAADLARLGWLYRCGPTPALIAVEVNGVGGTTIKKLRDQWAYPNLYKREVADDKVRGKKTRKLGWHTNEQNRPLMIAALAAALRDDPEALASRRLVLQMRQFVWSKGTPTRGSRAEARVGAHDDLVIAAAGVFALYQQRAQMPVSVRKPRGPMSLDDVIRERQRGKSRKSIAQRAPRAAA